MKNLLERHLTRPMRTLQLTKSRLICALAFSAFCALPTRAQTVATQPFRAIHLETRADETQKQRFFVARVDLTDPNVDVRVAPGGPDPDGDGPWQTTLLTPSVIAQREHFELAINGDFFSARQTTDAEGAQSGFVTGKWALAVGPAATDGFVWAVAAKARPALTIDAAKNARIARIQEVPTTARQVVAGSDLLLQNGKSVLNNDSKFSTNRHPRTAVGLADKGKTLVLVVADGRDSQNALGLTLGELTDLMKSLGCDDALNLDGGGSSEMVLRAPQDGRLRALNHPSDGRERAVANVLGVSIRGSLRVPMAADGDEKR